MSPNIAGANASTLTEAHASKASAITRARFLAPVLLVNGGAIIGQCLWAWDHLVPEALRGGWGIAPGVLMAVAFACALESIGIYLSAEADEAAKANLASGTLRLGSYVVGVLIGAINYAHFAGPHMAPTALAVTLLILSTLSPVMWAIRSRRVNRSRLVELGLVEPRGLKVSLGRKLWHPVLSFHLLRWAAWAGVQDVDQAVAAWDKAGRPRTSGRAGAKLATLVEAEAEAILAKAVEAASGEAEAQRAAVVVEAEAILAEARREAEAEIVEAEREAKARVEAELLDAQRRAEAELAEAARQAAAQRWAADAARREAEREAAEILATAEALAGEAKAPRRPAPGRDEVAERRRRRVIGEQDDRGHLTAIRAEAERLGRCPNRAEVKALCRVGSPKADALIAAYRDGDQVVEVGR